MREVTILDELGVLLRFVHGSLKIVFLVMSLMICTINFLSDCSFKNP